EMHNNSSASTDNGKALSPHHLRQVRGAGNPLTSAVRTAGAASLPPPLSEQADRQSAPPPQPSPATQRTLAGEGARMVWITNEGGHQGGCIRAGARPAPTPIARASVRLGRP